MKAPVGTKVEVLTGDQEESLGEGTYIGDVPVYFIVMPDGSLRSLSDAEQEPPPDMVPEGGKVIKVPDNPKIKLDSGEIVYGCQVWWQPVAGWKTLEELEDGPPNIDGNGKAESRKTEG